MKISKILTHGKVGGQQQGLSMQNSFGLCNNLHQDKNQQQKNTLKDKELSGSHPNLAQNEFPGRRALWFMTQLRWGRFPTTHLLSPYLPNHIRWFSSADTIRITQTMQTTVTLRPGEWGYHVVPSIFPSHPHYDPSKPFLGKPNKAVHIYQAPQWHGTNVSALLSNEMFGSIYHWKHLSLRMESKRGGREPRNSSYPINHWKTQVGYVIYLVYNWLVTENQN